MQEYQPFVNDICDILLGRKVYLVIFALASGKADGLIEIIKRRLDTPII